MAKKRKSGKKVQGGWRVHLMLVFLIVLSAVFLSTAIIFYIALIPTFVAFFVDQSRNKAKALTVGAFNFIGCLPFVLELWKENNSVEGALEIIVNPMTLVIVYAAAGLGYVVDWCVVRAVSNMLYKQGVKRREEINERKKNIVERWGERIKGDDYEIGPVQEE